MTTHADLARSLTESLELALPPIAVAFADAPPPGVPRLDARAAAGCQFWERAATGPFATLSEDHAGCAIGIHTHHMPPASEQHATDLSDALAVFADMDYVRPEEVAGIPVLEGETRCVVYAPLAETPLDPEVVLLFAHSRQGLVLTEAAQRVEPGAPPALGRPACAIVPAAVASGRAALSLGCCGARAYLDALSDDTALWALPGARLADYAREIEGLAHANRTLGAFHELRRRDYEEGRQPTVRESLERFQAASAG